ncbi:MAG: hypothetical protein HYS67_09540 [Deltaproteobacteria bacterium]|nr:hypothetical protein [Deltaproteobacteria bacterium]
MTRPIVESEKSVGSRAVLKLPRMRKKRGARTKKRTSRNTPCCQRWSREEAVIAIFRAASRRL